MRNKLTIQQANDILLRARTLKRKTGLRLGQAIMHELPNEIYEEVSGSHHDMFYFIDDEVTVDFFFKQYT